MPDTVQPTSLVDAYAVVKVLSQQAGIRNFAVVINPSSTRCLQGTVGATK